jgi:hypothetical protein
MRSEVTGFDVTFILRNSPCGRFFRKDVSSSFVMTIWSSRPVQLSRATVSVNVEQHDLGPRNTGEEWAEYRSAGSCQHVLQRRGAVEHHITQRSFTGKGRPSMYRRVLQLRTSWNRKTHPCKISSFFFDWSRRALIKASWFLFFQAIVLKTMVAWWLYCTICSSKVRPII